MGGNKKITTRTCGKCKTAFPIGQGHDSRTCGRKFENVINTATKTHTPTYPQHTPNTKPPILKTNPIIETKREVPSALFNAIRIDASGEVEVTLKKGKHAKGSRVSLPLSGLANKYNHIDDGVFGVWFNEKGQPHRLDGPAVEYREGGKEWWVDGKLHRTDGPAVKYRRQEEWYNNGKLHRLDGPAVRVGSSDEEWWVNGVMSCFPDLCKSALNQKLTQEKLYALCTHEDYVVREVALNNPSCPKQFAILGKLLSK